jgi:hypothetical protein
VLVSRAADGTWTTHKLDTRLTPGISYVSADVDQSIYQTALGLGAHDQQVVDFADIFGYDIDFQREVHPGDRFGMLYESFQDERGADVKTGVVLMAEFDGAALSKTFYRYTPSDDGNVDYFDATGQSAKKFLMKTPINGARLSSAVHPRQRERRRSCVQARSSDGRCCRRHGLGGAGRSGHARTAGRVGRHRAERGAHGPVQPEPVAATDRALAPARVLTAKRHAHRLAQAR